MNVWLMWLATHRSDVVLGVMVVAATLNVYAFMRQQRLLVELRRLLLLVRQGAIERRPLVLSNGVVGHRYSVTPRMIGGEGDDN